MAAQEHQCTKCYVGVEQLTKAADEPVAMISPDLTSSGVYMEILTGRYLTYEANGCVVNFCEGPRYPQCCLAFSGYELTSFQNFLKIFSGSYTVGRRNQIYKGPQKGNPYGQKKAKIDELKILAAATTLDPDTKLRELVSLISML